jgi:hypothetical protein
MDAKSGSEKKSFGSTTLPLGHQTNLRSALLVNYRSGSHVQYVKMAIAPPCPALWWLTELLELNSSYPPLLLVQFEVLMMSLVTISIFADFQCSRCALLQFHIVYISVLTVCKNLLTNCIVVKKIQRTVIPPRV